MVTGLPMVHGQRAHSQDDLRSCLRFHRYGRFCSLVGDFIAVDVMAPQPSLLQ